MEKEEKVVWDTAGYLIHLLKCVLDDTIPREKPEDLSFEACFKLAVFHQVECMAFYGVEKLKKRPKPSLYLEWKENRDRNIIKNFTQIAERDSIVGTLTRENVNVLPLKGCLLMEMYPQADYRQMVDLDILIEKNKAKQVKNIMEKLEYKSISYKLGNHDVYEKPPYMGVEIHRELMGLQNRYYDYYSNVWDKAIECESVKGYFQLSWDDYYILMLCHFAKHHQCGGSGIRSIMDIHVFLTIHGHELHKDYVKKELVRLKLWEFKESVEELADVWFGQRGMSANKTGLADYIVTSGAYGTTERRIENEIAKVREVKSSPGKTKTRYYLKRLFLDYKTMCGQYPYLKRLPVFLPLAWLHRLVCLVLFGRKRIKREITLVNRLTNKE